MHRKIGLTEKMSFPIGMGSKPLSMRNRPAPKDAIKVLHTAFDLGVNFIDTANVYCMGLDEIGHNEKLISEAIKQYSRAKEIFVATKGGSRPEVAGGTDCRPYFLRKSCEKSLIDLNIDSIFLYQLHTIDPRVTLPESIHALIDLKNEGKIQHIGLSNVEITEIKEALKLTRIESVQNRCNVFYKKDINSGLIEFCRENNITYLPYTPVGGSSNIKNTENILLQELGVKYETSTYCIMLSWLLNIYENILPIPGASKIESISDSVKAVNVRLSNEDILKLNNLPDDV